MILNNSTIYEHYLDCLRPFANDTAIKLTAPASMFDAFDEIADDMKTHRLDVLRFACSEFIHNYHRKNSRA